MTQLQHDRQAGVPPLLFRITCGIKISDGRRGFQMEKAKSVLRRAAALLAALCLAASMTLPVYAEGAEAADTTAIAVQDDTIETPTPEENTTEPQDAETTPTPEPTAEPTAEPTPTPELTAEPTAEPTITPEITAEPTTEPTITPELTHTPEPTVTPTPDEDAADDADEVETDDNIDNTNDIAVCAENGNSYNVYFAPPSDWGAPDRVTVRVLRGSDGTNLSEQRTQTMTKTDRNTKDGRPIYTTAILYQQGSDVFCSYGGFVWIHFERGDGKWVGMNGSGSNNWIQLDSIIDKCFDAKNAHNGSDISWNESWWKALNDISVPYTKYADQQIRFCNKGETDLEQVTAQFYIKDENGILKPVGDPIIFDSEMCIRDRPTTRRTTPSACPTSSMTPRTSTTSWIRRRCRTSSSPPATTASSR